MLANTTSVYCKTFLSSQRKPWFHETVSLLSLHYISGSSLLIHILSLRSYLFSVFCICVIISDFFHLAYFWDSSVKISFYTWIICSTWIYDIYKLIRYTNYSTFIANSATVAICGKLFSPVFNFIFKFEELQIIPHCVQPFIFPLAMWGHFNSYIFLANNCNFIGVSLYILSVCDLVVQYSLPYV